MASISVDLDIDLCDIETDDLVEEVCNRLKSNTNRKSISIEKKQDLKDQYLEMVEALSIWPYDEIQIKSLDDKMKYEHIVKVFSKYTSSQFENLLP